ncbi:ATP-binding protein [Polyangium jinanense]|uniref:histidine kinase n=1 Tax=Polyangium jinanense TaxID=2829994 RepID=A0A9X3X0Q1_9BACT|nr:ATP-binding protein [Polyangium jinanense]MDC3955313.1 MASE1 domain-containing protein [Polyangium jinanense]MDC3981614.1 MASE1 domain-containing protein [Polyangium jinanense]
MARSGKAAWSRTLGPAAMLFTSYFLLADWGLQWATVPGAGSPVFPAAGVALAGLLLGGLRLWPAVFAGRMAAFFLDGRSFPMWAQCAIAAGNTIAAVGGAWILTRVHVRPALTRLRDMLALIGACVVSSAVGATIGSSTLASVIAHGFGRAPVLWLTWWAGNVMGMLVVTPLVLSWMPSEPIGRSFRWWLHLVLSTVTAGAVAWFIFGPHMPHLPLAWLIFPALMWAALAGGVRGATAAMLPSASAAVWGTTAGYGPFAPVAEHLRLVLLQQFVAVAAASTLVLAVVVDERRRSELLRENEERLRLASRAGRTGVWTWNLTTGRAFWTPEACELYGYGMGCTVDYERWIESVHPDDREQTRRKVREAVEQAQSGGSGPHSYKDEYRVTHVDGTTLWLESSGAIERKGDELVMLGVIRDITERKLAEAALHESEAHIRRVLDNLFAFVGVLDLEGTVLQCNRAPLEAANITAVDVLGKKFWDCYWWSGLPEAQARIRDAMDRAKRGEVVRFDVTARMAGNSLICVDFQLAPLRDDEGRVTHLLPSGMDITARKRAENERERLLESERAARAEAERASRLKDEFLSTVSHELRTPLTLILGWSQVLRRRANGKDQDLHKGLAVIDRNARVLSQLIEDLLDMGRFSTGKTRLEVQSVDLHDVVALVLSSVAPSAAAKHIELESISRPFPGRVCGDLNRLQQVIWNLVSNAVKFTPSGGKVEVTLDRIDDLVEITVSDTGQGIKPEFLPHVFERFRQADSSPTRVHGGLGLGLAIVKNLVELHGGTVRVTSDGEGKGATFVVRLPIEEARVSEGAEVDDVSNLGIAVRAVNDSTRRTG